MDNDLLVFFHPETLKRIISLREWFLDKKLDQIDEWIRMVVLNRLTGHSPGFFSVYTMPPNQAVSADSQRKINKKRNQTPEPRNVDELIIKKSKILLSDGSVKTDNFRFGSSPVNETKFIDDNEVDLIVTSPPFLDVVDYKTDNWLRCWFAGIDAEKINISKHKSLSDWQNFIHEAFVEFERVVKKGGHVAFEVGEVRNGKVKLEKLVAESIKGLRFDLLGVIINAQKFTKTSNCWGIINNSKGTNTNRIVLCKKIATIAKLADIPVIGFLNSLLWYPVITEYHMINIDTCKVFSNHVCPGANERLFLEKTVYKLKIWWRSPFLRCFVDTIEDRSCGCSGILGKHWEQQNLPNTLGFYLAHHVRYKWAAIRHCVQNGYLFIAFVECSLNAGLHSISVNFKG